MDGLLLAETKPKREPCKGMVFRYRLNHYVNAGGNIVWHEEFRRLKRMSCSGCAKCGWLYDAMREGRKLSTPSTRFMVSCTPLRSRMSFRAGKSTTSSKISICN